MADRARERATVCGVHVKTGVIIGAVAQVIALLLAVAVCVVLLTIVGIERVGGANETANLNATDEVSRLLDINEAHNRFYDTFYPNTTAYRANRTNSSSSLLSWSFDESDPFQYISTAVHLVVLALWLLTIPLLLISLPCERTDLILANICGALLGVLMAVVQMVIFILRLVNSGDEAHDRALLYIFIFVLLATIPLAAVGLIVDVQWYSYVHAKNGAQCICCCDPWPEGTTTEGQRGAVSGGFSTNGATHSNGHDHRVIEAPAEEIPIQQFSRF